MPIDVVGDVQLNDSGGAHLVNWRFKALGLPDGMELDVPAEPGQMAGWSVAELHNIAHGVPCDCPIGQAVASEGLDS